MADGPGSIGEAPPQSPLVIVMAVLFRATLGLRLTPAESTLPVPATPLSVLEPPSV